MNETNAAVSEASEQKAEEFQETRIGRLPTDWLVETLSEAVSINPEGWDEDDWPTDTFEYVSLEDASEGEIQNSSSVPLDEAPSRAQRGIREGDVLVGTVRPKQRSHGFVTEEHDGAICSSGFGVLRTEDSVNSSYLKQEVLSHRFFRQMEAYVAGSGYPAVKLSDLGKHRIAIPSLEEQRKIASVLYNIDQTIQVLGSTAECARRVQRGIAQRVFRRGLQDEAQRQTWLGEIPASWDVVPFSDLVESNRNGLYKSKDAYGDGYPIAKMGNALELKYLDMEDFDRLELAEDELEKYRLREGDLIFARRAQEASGAGGCTLVADLAEPTVFESSLIRVRLSDETIPEFYMQYFNGPVGGRSIKRIVTETTISGIATSDLLNLKVALPPIDTQERIADILSKYDQYTLRLLEERQQLEKTKKGLMQDLLSAEVRTHDKDIDVLPEVKEHG